MYFVKDMLEVVTVVDANHFNVSTCLPKAAEAGSPLEGFASPKPTWNTEGPGKVHGRRGYMGLEISLGGG